MAAAATLIKIGSIAVKNRKGVGKVLMLIVGIVVGLIIMSSAVAGSLLSFFTADSANIELGNIEASESYQELMEIYHEYMDEELMPKLQERRNQLHSQKNDEYYIWEADPERIEEEAPQRVEVSVHLNEINPAYLMAFLTHSSDDFKLGVGKVDRMVAYMFFSNINKIAERKIDDGEYVVFNAFATPEEAGVIFFEDPTIYEMYLMSFELYTQYTGLGNISVAGLDGDYRGTGDLTNVPNTGMPIPVYYQNDYKDRYGNGTIATSGCGPTCIAMVLSYLDKSNITPSTIVSAIGNKYYVPGAGSSWAIFDGCASLWGRRSTNHGRNLEKVLEELQAGHPVIASLGPGTFTSSGHFIVIRGSTTDGYFLINDPNKNNYTKYGTDRFEIQKVFSEAKNFWSFQ